MSAPTAYEREVLFGKELARGQLDDALKRAEKRIQRILIDLEEETGKEVHHVEVDTRNFAQLSTSIIVR